MIEGVADALEMMCRHVHVHFRRLDGAVTEHGLDGAQVGMVFEQVGREAMPERVRRDMLLDSGFSRDGGNHPLDTARIQRAIVLGTWEEPCFRLDEA